MALDGALTYITKHLSEGQEMEYDLRKTLGDLFQDPSVRYNSDFLLYVTGYAQFFGTDIDQWCNDQYWSIPTFNPFASTPYPSTELRQTINNHVSKVNNLYQSVASSYFTQTRYVDLNKRFAGHQSCEPGASYQDPINTETHFDNIYLWNLNYPYQITAQGAPSAQAEAGNVSPQEAQDLLLDQGVTAWNGSGSQGGNDPANGWRLRPFYSRFSGYTSIKDAIFEQMHADGLPKVSHAPLGAQPAAPAASSPSSTQPAAPACSHVGDGFHCQCSDGSTRDIDEDERCCVTDPITKIYNCYSA